MPPPTEAEEAYASMEAARHQTHDPHMRSCKVITGYHLERQSDSTGSEKCYAIRSRGSGSNPGNGRSRTLHVSALGPAERNANESSPEVEVKAVEFSRLSITPQVSARPRSLLQS